MKNRILLLVVCFLFVSFLEASLNFENAFAQEPTIDCEGTLRAWRMDHNIGPAIADQYYCPHPHRSPVLKSAVPWSTTAPAGGFKSSEQFAAQALGSLLGSLMQNLFAPPPQVDTSYQEQLRKQQTEAAKIKEKELKRQKSLRQWQELQEKKAAEKAEKERQSRELLAKMETFGAEEPLGMESVRGGKLEAFKWEKHEEELELQALGTGRYDTSTLSAWQRLLCAAHFSNQALMAIKDGDEVRARYLNEQAEKVSSGQMIELECKFPVLPQPPQPEKAESKMASYVNLLGKVQKDIKTLQDIEIKIKETDVKKKQAESKKEKAEKMIAESDRARNTGKPKDKAKSKSLKDEAQRLLQEAQNELEQVNKRRKELLNEQDKIQDELKQMQEQIE